MVETFQTLLFFGKYHGKSMERPLTNHDQSSGQDFQLSGHHLRHAPHGRSCTDWCHAGKLCEAPLALCPAGPGEITAWMEESHHFGQFWSTLVREIQKLAQANVGGAGHFLVMNPNR
jgi:hypothetical protein